LTVERREDFDRWLAELYAAQEATADAPATESDEE